MQKEIKPVAVAQPQDEREATHAEYGDTDFGFTFAGIQLEEGDKRLASLIIKALGTAHPAMDDLVSLLFRARATPSQDAVDAARFRGVREMNCEYNGTSPAEFNADIDMVLAEFYAAMQAQGEKE